jgi:hypothetical protein
VPDYPAFISIAGLVNSVSVKCVRAAGDVVVCVFDIEVGFSCFEDVATAIETEATLVDQPLKTELEYRVIAINESGEEQPINTVMAVL